MTPVVWAALLLLAGLGLVVLEIFIPSGGILGITATAAILASVVLAFLQGPLVGAGFLASTMVALPVAVVLALKLWPQTTMGRRVLLPVLSGDEVKPDLAEQRGLNQLVGQVGTAKNVMLPSGPVEFDGRTIDAVSEGMAIERGEMVTVVEVRGTRVVVRPIVGAQLAEPPKDELSGPIASDEIDPFDNPLA